MFEEVLAAGETDLILAGTEKKLFSFLFEKTTPKDFAAVFRDEAAQTRAFLLSFAPDAGYVSAVLDICKDDDFTALVTNYVGRVEDESVDIEFVRRVEQYVKDIIGKNKTMFSGVLRKNMIIEKTEAANG